MHRSIQVAFGLMVANLALMTAPGMLVYGLGGALLADWLPPITNSFDFALFGAAGLFWPAGIPLVVFALKPLRSRWHIAMYVLVLLALLYLWAVTVTVTVTVAAVVHSSLGHVVPMPEVNGKRLELDRSSDIRGPDNDNNGIRDDIDAWIAAQPISDEQKKAARQAARVRQAELLVDLTNKVELDRLGDLSMASVKCLRLSFMPDYQRGYDLSSTIVAITANTKQRAKQYLA
jgi:hypothetical protein